jgi:hypothetical protein
VSKHQTMSSALLGFVVFFSVLAGATESTTCTGNVSRLVTDGRIVHSTIPDATTFFWEFDGFAGRSYSVELSSEVDGTLPTTAFVLYNTVDDCTTLTSTLNLNANSNTDPILSGPGLRRSFIAPADGTYIIRMVNNSGSIHLYDLRVTDTTLYTPRWSTYAGFVTQWGFRNTTNTDITVTLTATGVLPVRVPVQIAFVVPAGGEVFKTIAAMNGDMNVGKNQAGYAEAAHDGPPGAIVADAYMEGGLVFLQSLFEARNASH